MRAVTLPAYIDRRIEYEPTSGCWIWTGARQCGPNDYRHYGSIWADGRNKVAHRFIYKMLRGPIPDGLTLDHICRLKQCVNPDHLEPVTREENSRRKGTTGMSARNAVKTHCPNGHPYSGRNLRVYRGGRRCIACWR